MKKVYLLIMILCFPAQCMGQMGFGALIGMSTSQIGGIEEFDQRSRTGVSFGGYFIGPGSTPNSRIGLELVYIQKGSVFDIDGLDIPLTINYIEIASINRFRLKNSPIFLLVRFSSTVGITECKAGIAEIDCSGIGFDVGIGPGLSYRLEKEQKVITIDVLYEWGTKLMDNQFRNRCLMVRWGVGYKFK